MKFATTLLGLATAFILVSSVPTSVHAQNIKSFVSGTGIDTNPCTRAAPCQTFATALANTTPGGEIDCLDPGTFGGLVINMAITIDCGSGETGDAGGPALGSGSVVVQAGPNDVVQLRKMTMNGFALPTSGGLNGIQFLSGKSLTIDNVNIMNVRNNGIDVQTSGTVTLEVINTNITNSGNNGIGVAASGSGFFNVSLQGVRMSQGFHGLRVADNGSATMHVSVENSVASNNSSSGFIATTGGGRLTMLVEHSSSVNNGATGVVADGSNTELHIGNSRVFGNATGVAATNGASLLSYKNNDIKLNGNNGAPTGSVSGD